MDCKKTSDSRMNCVQCTVLLAILERLGIDVNVPRRCQEPTEKDIQEMKTRKEVISMLNIDPSTYTRWVKQGILVPWIVGSRHFYDDEDLERAWRESIRKGKR